MPFTRHTLGETVKPRNTPHIGPKSEPRQMKNNYSTSVPNANLVIDSADRNEGTYLTPKLQPVNDFEISRGFNILQGQFNTLKVQEVKFPFVCPNICNYNNRFIVTVQGVLENVITIDEGFYTGDQLATAIQTQFNIIPAPTRPTITYLQDGRFQLTAAPGETVGIRPLFAYNNYIDDVFTLDAIPYNTPSLLRTMGLSEVTNPAVNNTIIGTVAPMTYTDYVDVVSDVLTQYQEATDTSTSIKNQRHIICRIYLADETSTATTDEDGLPVLPGSSAFIAHRQFKNPKIIKWNGLNSIDRIDLKLLDQWGNPYAYEPRGFIPNNAAGSRQVLQNSVQNFQLTLTATEESD